MLFAYVGTDRKKVRAELWKAACAEKGEIERIIEGPEMLNDVRRALRGGGLFGTKRVVILDSLLENEETQSVLVELFEDVAASETPFFIFEEKVNAEINRILKKHAESLFEFDVLKQKKDDGVFAVANALGMRNRKKLWVAYMRAIHAGAKPEAIHGMLWWKVKQLFANPCGFEREKLEKMAADLVELPHETRRNGIELEYALERWLLKP